ALRPELGANQALALVVAWTHGVIGMRGWMRLRPWYARAQPILFAGALLLPVLALLGFVHAGREAAQQAQEPGGATRVLQPRYGPAEALALKRAEAYVYLVFGGALGLVLVARVGRRALARHHGAIRVAYPDRRVVLVPVGFSILEASRLAQIAHASVCGGRGRCSTCRVHVVAGLESIPPASSDERRVLERVGAPPGVRRAGQARPRGDVGARLLLPAVPAPSDALPRPRSSMGSEQDITVLFADLRRFTTLAEHRLPYDVVFFLNRYFEAVGRAIEAAGGIANQFTGDGV